MSLDGKRDNFELDDFRACAENASMKRGRAEDTIERVLSVVLKWRDYAKKAGVPDDVAAKIENAQRKDILA